ncbi:glycerol kinase GlpK [Cohnella massiliensis]|uniref:glycerol kinase GlpK n=1 Tax=Cohnella massiliensis TaxID=1816691 RepID=UPI0009BB2850|nr:glycerol kinase GlpK [Cohnella massiliensis]
MRQNAENAGNAKYVLTLDQGTTASRAILFDRKGNPKAVAKKEFKQHYPRPGWVEHDAEEIWESQSAVMYEVLQRADVAPEQIAAISITNQRETTVVWNRLTGQPIYRAIVWQSKQSADICNRLKAEGFEPAVREKTGLILDPYFCGSKIRWILDHVPQAREMAERGELLFGTIDTWLLWKLTDGKVHATDCSNASRTLLFNIHELEWDPELLRMLDIPASMLPEVKPSSHIYGYVSESLFPVPIPIAGMAGDQHASLFGHACFEKGMAKNTYGTGCFLLMNTGSEPVSSDNGLLTTIAWGIDGKIVYALEGSIFIAGAVVKWLRDGLKTIWKVSDSDEHAAAVPSADGVYFVPAFVGLGAPYWDMEAKGAIFGLTARTTEDHIIRAAVESIAYQTKDVLTAMEADSGIRLVKLTADGGAAANEFLMQWQADLLNVPIERPRVLETAALGAAYLAGLAVGLWRDQEEISLQIRTGKDRTYEPDLAEEVRQERYEGWVQAVHAAMAFKTKSPNGKR